MEVELLQCCLPVKPLLVAIVVTLASAAVVAAAKPIHGFIAAMPTEKLRQLFPSATSFLPRGDADPRYFTAHAGDAKAPGAKPLG